MREFIRHCCFALALTMFVGLLTGCGGTSPAANLSQAASPTPTSNPVTTPAVQTPPTPSKPTIIVKTLDDDPAGCPDNCTLRSAIASAKPGEVIGFESSLSGTITLADTLNIDKNLTIVGTGPDKVAISGSNQIRVLHIAPQVTVNLTGLTITAGSPTNGDPTSVAGIFNEGVLSMTRCSVTGNKGTGIFNFGGSLSLVDSTVSQNKYAGIMSRSSTQFTDQKMWKLATATVINSKILDNSDSGIVSDDPNNTLVLSKTTISGNKAQRSGPSLGFGGGIRSTGKLTLSDSKIANNTAEEEGGGIYAGSTLVGGGITIPPSVVANSIISDNAARSKGGGIAGSNITVTDSIISGNSAAVSGGGIYGLSLILTNTAVVNNHATGGGSFVPHGGGILIQGGSITNSTIAGNSVDWQSRDNPGGGGGGLEVYDTVNLANSTIANNTANLIGGISVADNTTLNLTSSIVSGNKGKSPDVGGKVKSLGHNLVGNSTGLIGLFASDLKDIDPMLAALAINAPGTTETLALRPGSPAIGKGKCDQAKTDQRGVARKSVCDIGAFERVSEDDTRITGPTVPPPTATPDASSLSPLVMMGSTWKFGRADGSVIAEHVTFNPDGTLDGHSNRNEARWKIEDGGCTLVFYTSDGKASTRFTDVNIELTETFQARR